MDILFLDMFKVDLEVAQGDVEGGGWQLQQ